MITLLALLGRAQAADVLIPEATPASMGDFSVAYMVYDLVVGQVENKGLDVLDADEIREVAGDAADACSDVDDCPANLWDKTDARLAVVIAIGQGDGGIAAEARLYGWDSPQPLKTIRKTLPAGGEVGFAQDLAKAVAAAYQLVPERQDDEEIGGIGEKPVAKGDTDAELDFDEEELPPAKPTKSTKVVREDPGYEDDEEEEAPPKKSTSTKSSSKKVVEEEEEEEEEEEDAPPKKSTKKADPPKSAAKAKEPPPPPPKKEREATPKERFASDPRAVDERRKMNIPWSAYAAYRESGLDQAEWLKKAQVHAGQAYVEATGGYALGDTNRGYDVRVSLDEQFVTTGQSSWTGPGTGGGVTGRVSVGYVPSWFIDTAVSVGLQAGNKSLTVGWECPACTEPNSETPYAAVSATQMVIEPRVRLLPLATGPVKPYALVGFTFSIYDGFHIPDEQGAVDYPDIDGGAAFGPTAGLGVMIDPVSPISIVVEAPFNLVLSDGEAATVDPDLETVPTTLESDGWVLRVVGGVAVRF